VAGFFSRTASHIGKRKDKIECAFALIFLFDHDFFRPAFARRSIKRDDKGAARLRAGGKPVSTFRHRALANPAEHRESVQQPIAHFAD
jgi:hypothetical protein